MKLPSTRLLAHKKIPYRVIRLQQAAVTVRDVIKYSCGDIKPDEICKTMILKTKEENIALFMGGTNRIDFKKLRQLFGKISIVRPEKIKAITGVEPGAVCPLVLDISVFVDERVFEKEKINFGSGNHLYGIEMSPLDLGKVIEFEVIDAIEV